MLSKWALATTLVGMVACDGFGALPGPADDAHLRELPDLAAIADAARPEDRTAPGDDAVATVDAVASGDAAGTRDAAASGDASCAESAPQGPWQPCPRMPTLVVTSGCGPTALAVDDSALYWIDAAAPRVVRMARGSAPMPLAPVAGDATLAWDLVLDADSVYFTEPGTVQGISGTPGALWKVAKAGGPATRLAWANPASKASINNFIGHPARLAIDAQRLYWTENVGIWPPPMLSPGYIGSVPKTGGKQITIVDAHDDPFGIAVDDQWVYFGGDNDAGAARAAKDGSHWDWWDPTDFADSRVAVDGENLYLADYRNSPGNLYIVPKAMSIDHPAPAFQSTSVGDDRVVDLALDLDHVYWSTGLAANPSRGHVLKMRKDGVGGAVVLAAEPGSSIAVDGDSVYWTTSTGVKRICK